MVASSEVSFSYFFIIYIVIIIISITFIIIPIIIIILYDHYHYYPLIAYHQRRFYSLRLMINRWKTNTKIWSFIDAGCDVVVHYQHHHHHYLHHDYHHHHQYMIWRKSNLQLYFNKLQFYQLSRLNKRRYIYVSSSVHTLKSLKQAMIQWHYYNYHHHHYQRSLLKKNNYDNIYKQTIMMKYFYIMITMISSQVNYRMNVYSCDMLWIRKVYQKFVFKLKKMIFLSNLIYNIISTYNNNHYNKYIILNDRIILKTKLINIFNYWKDRIVIIRKKIPDKMKYKYQQQYYIFKKFLLFINKIENIRQMILINEYNNHLIYFKYIKKYFCIFYNYYIYKKQIINISNYHLYHKSVRLWKLRIIMLRKLKFHYKHIILRVTIKSIINYLLIWKKYILKRKSLKIRYNLFRKKYKKYSKFYNDYNIIQKFFISWKYEYIMIKKTIKLNYSIIRNKYHHFISLKYFHKWEEIYFILIEKRQYLIYGFKILYKYHLRIHSKLIYLNDVMNIYYNNNNYSNNINNIITTNNNNINTTKTNTNKDDFHVINNNNMNKNQNNNKINHIKRLSILSLSKFLYHIYNITNFHIKTRKNLQLFYNYCYVRRYYNQWKNIYITKKYYYLPSQYVYNNYQHVINYLNQFNYLYNKIYNKYNYKKVLYNTMKSWYKLYNIYQKYHDFISRILVMKRIFIKWIHKYNDIIMHTLYNIQMIPIIKKQQNNNKFHNKSYYSDDNTKHHHHNNYNNDDDNIYDHQNTTHKVRKLIQINKEKLIFQYRKKARHDNPTTNKFNNNNNKNNDNNNNNNNNINNEDNAGLITTTRYVRSRNFSSSSCSSSSSSSSYNTNSSILSHIEKQLRKINKSILSEHHHNHSLGDKSSTRSINSRRYKNTASSISSAAVATSRTTTTTTTTTTGTTFPSTTYTTATTTTTTPTTSGATIITFNSHKDLMVDYTSLNTTTMSSLSSTTSSSIINSTNNNHYNGYLAKYKVKNMINKK